MKGKKKDTGFPLKPCGNDSRGQRGDMNEGKEKRHWIPAKTLRE